MIDEPIVNDDKAFFKNALSLAEAGKAREMITVGLCYANGFGVNSDVEKSTMWLNRSLLRKDPEATSDLGEIYLQGKLVKKDLKKAKSIILSLKDIYPLFGLYMLGRYYFFNSNNKKATNYFKKASKNGHVVSHIYYNKISRSGQIGYIGMLTGFVMYPYVILRCCLAVYSKKSYIKLWRYSDIIHSKKFERILIKQWSQNGII